MENEAKREKWEEGSRERVTLSALAEAALDFDFALVTKLPDLPSPLLPIVLR